VARPALRAKNALRNARIDRKMRIAVPPSLVARQECHEEDLLLAIAVTPLESTRTEYSMGTGRAEEAGDVASGGVVEGLG